VAVRFRVLGLPIRKRDLLSFCLPVVTSSSVGELEGGVPFFGQLEWGHCCAPGKESTVEGRFETSTKRLLS